jgi:hypothetical protein
VDTVKYKVTNTCGVATATKVVRVTTIVVTISGPAVVCVGSSASLSNTLSGGTWSTSSSAIVSVGAATGTITGVAAGTATITYAVGSLRAYYTVTVQAAGVASITVGTSTLCAGASTTFTNATTGGTWSAVLGRVTVSATGVVTGVTPGADTVRYTVVNACGTYSTFRTVTVTGPTLPLAIGGSGAAICPGATRVNSNTTVGGVWSLSRTGIATLSATSGASVTVTGLAGGVDTLKYTITNACGLQGVSRSVVTVNPAPNAGTISGPSSVVIGSSITLTNTGASGAGTWSNAFTTISSVSTAGVVRGRAAGLDTIRYRVSNSCGVAYARYLVTVMAARGVNSEEVTVNPTVTVFPNPSNGIITVTANEAITKVFVADLSGKMITEVTANDTKVEVDLSAYAPGAYVLRIATVNGVQMVKVVKE